MEHLKKFQGSIVSPIHQDLSNDTTFNQFQSRVPVPLTQEGSYAKFSRLHEEAHNDNK